jgi:hypothetical protein
MSLNSNQKYSLGGRMLHLLPKIKLPGHGVHYGVPVTELLIHTEYPLTIPGPIIRKTPEIVEILAIQPFRIAIRCI